MSNEEKKKPRKDLPNGLSVDEALEILKTEDPKGEIAPLKSPKEIEAIVSGKDKRNHKLDTATAQVIGFVKATDRTLKGLRQHRGTKDKEEREGIDVLIKHLELTRDEGLSYPPYKPQNWYSQRVLMFWGLDQQYPILEEVKPFAIGIHAANQFFGDSKQISLFSDEKVESFAEATGLQILNKPDSYGVALNMSQKRVFEGILKAFSDTNYKGEDKVSRGDSLKGVYSKKAKELTKVYENIESIPVIRLTQADIVKLSGYDMNNQKHKKDTVEALTHLATNQFCFYWVRLAKDGKGIPLKDKGGDYKKEEVMTVGTLLRIKTIREDGNLKYYEIHPSSVILDQVNSDYGGNYFLLVPNNWREEVKKLVGKKASSYTYEFLFWLRLKYEAIRRYNSNHKKKKPFLLKLTWEEVAQALKMPETVYRRNRKTGLKRIEDAYETAIALGYLNKVEHGGVTDILYLNEEFYPKPGDFQEDIDRLKRT
jgi:hypothetical protein